MKRPRPTSQLLVELCNGENGYQGLIAAVHHGLAEVSLREVYPLLDFDEAIAFAAASWEIRKERYPRFRQFVSEAPTLYDVFHAIFRKEIRHQGFRGVEIYDNVWRWFGKREPNEKLKDKHRRLNPYSGRDLQRRLAEAEPHAVARLKDSLRGGVSEYVFECDYGARKRERDGDNHGLVPMSFLTVYPRKGRIVPGYALEIARMVSGYPREVITDIPRKQVPVVARGEQMSLL